MRLLVATVVSLGLAACRPPGYGKHDKPDVDAAAGDGAVVVPDAAIDAAAATCLHAFRLEGHGTASSVWLTGDFVAWGGDLAHGAIAFTLGVDGAWTGSYSFAAGPHQYKLILDGTQWIVDPANPDTIDDGFGGKNSLYTCTP